MAVVPFALLMLLNRPQEGVRPIAEIRICRRAGGRRRSIPGFNEGAENWQSLWTCAIYFLFALTLWRARAAQIPK